MSRATLNVCGIAEANSVRAAMRYHPLGHLVRVRAVAQPNAAGSIVYWGRMPRDGWPLTFDGLGVVAAAANEAARIAQARVRAMVEYVGGNLDR